MRKPIVAILLVLVALSATGCSYIDKLSGSTDDTVLPGSRENAIPGKAQFPDASDTATVQPPGGQTAQTGTATAPEPACTAGDANCAPSSDGTFSDPQ